MHIGLATHRQGYPDLGLIFLSFTPSSPRVAYRYLILKKQGPRQDHDDQDLTPDDKYYNYGPMWVDVGVREVSEGWARGT